MKVYQYKGFGFVEGFASNMTFEEFYGKIVYHVKDKKEAKKLFTTAGGKLSKKKSKTEKK